MKTLLALSAINVVVPIAVNQGAEIHVNSPSKRQALWNHIDQGKEIFSNPRYILSNVSIKNSYFEGVNSIQYWYGRQYGWDNQCDSRKTSVEVRLDYTDNLTLETQEIFIKMDSGRGSTNNKEYALTYLKPGYKVSTWHGPHHTTNGMVSRTEYYVDPTYYSAHPETANEPHHLPDARVSIPGMFRRAIFFDGFVKAGWIRSHSKGLNIVDENHLAGTMQTDNYHINYGNYMNGFGIYDGDKNISYGLQAQGLFDHLAYDTALSIYKTLNLSAEPSDNVGMNFAKMDINPNEFNLITHYLGIGRDAYPDYPNF